MALFIWNVASFKLAPFSTNKQAFVHYPSNSTSQLIKGKSSDLQKLIRCSSGKVTSVFKVGYGGRDSWSRSSWETGARGGITIAFPYIFVLND